MKLKKSRIFILLVAAVTLFFISVASAYTLMPWGFYLATAPIDTNYIGSTYRNAFETAMSCWDGCQSERYIIYSPGNQNIGYSANVSDTVNGRYEILAYNLQALHYTTKYQILLNERYIGTDFTLIRSTSAHEIGHVFGLDDLTSGTAIMNVNRDRASIYNPQTDDINGVLANWP